MISDVVDRFRVRHPAARLVHIDLNPVDPLTPLRNGEIDVAHLWLPVGEPDITVGPIARGRVVASWDDQLKVASAGEAVIACPAEAARFYPRPNLVFLPVRDAAPVRWAFAWHTAATNPVIRSFIDAVETAPTDT